MARHDADCRANVEARTDPLSAAPRDDLKRERCELAATAKRLLTCGSLTAGPFVQQEDYDIVRIHLGFTTTQHAFVESMTESNALFARDFAERG